MLDIGPETIEKVQPEGLSTTMVIIIIIAILALVVLRSGNNTKQ